MREIRRKLSHGAKVVSADSLTEVVADRLFQLIVDGKYPAQSSLPPEGELAALFEVSRVTIREAIRILRARNVVQIRRGRGTEVNPPQAWTSLEAILRATLADTEPGVISRKLLEARRMIEIGAVQLAAFRRSDKHLISMYQSLEVMRAAADRGDSARIAEADIKFHQTIMEASGNPFVPLLFNSFGPLLVKTRHETPAIPQIQRNAIDRHAEILAALTKGDPEAARIAMVKHMDQIERDFRTYLLDPPMADVEPMISMS
jgi:DNA-binding FadR family transcriptional regulator